MVGADEVQHGADQVLPVDARVLEVPVVLASEEGRDEPLRDLVEVQRMHVVGRHPVSTAFADRWE